MIRHDFKKTYCKNCTEKCSHAKNCYKQMLLRLYNEASACIDLQEELKSKSPREVADLLKTFGYDFTFLDVYGMMNIKGIPRRTVQEAAKSEQRLNAYKETCLRKYGVENTLSKGTVFYDKRNKTVKDKYGVDNVFQLEETKEKIKNTIVEHFGDYQGFYNYMKEKFLKKYGVENPWQIDSVQKKCTETKLEKYGSVNCSNIHMNSSIHRKVSEFLNSLNIQHENENTKLIRYYDDDGKLHWPVPDIHLLGQFSNIIIEVNGNYWHANPKLYKENDLIRRFGGYVKAKDVWEKDLERNHYIEKLGYKVLVIWEDEIENGSFCEKILNFL